MGVGTDTVRGRKVVADGDRETEYSVGKAGLCGKLGIGCWKKEGEGPLAPFFDEIETDDQLGQDNWEEAESMLQQKAARLAIKKAGCCPEDIRIIFAGICWHSPSLLPSGSANWSVQCTEYSGRVLRWVKH